ncbi:TonB-system energizer ExbB [Campylobacter sp. faydin G-140]|uniref:TonB-system energizer ExbB n=1 Tax=Campylobacter anatolicus TaxID=2829105 RepID=UPI001B92A2F4|nr:TonB-system energizer ExbB [Campylobacter anatolicus]MBR8461417.1 TonB-system energizer ExbB [Campylobacter anatolicus]MBR8466125.1 TonB-system energizer ExbB [Campylobacter anatolicus]
MEFLKHHIDFVIFAILGFMSFIVVWFSIERCIFLSKVNFKEYNNEDELEIGLTKNLTTLYIIYSNAPYIGLLGTVIGIMVTFYDMGMGGGIDAKNIMVGLSLALKATAMGLVVAIPTLMIYNALYRKVEVVMTKFKAYANEVI